MPAIKAVGLDVFSFLVSAQRLLPDYEVADLLGIGPDMVRAAANNPDGNYWGRAQCGKFGNLDRWTEILGELTPHIDFDWDNDTVGTCVMLEARVVMQHCRPFPGMYDLLSGLKSRWLRYGILTNATPTHLALEQILELPREVDVFLASCEVGMDKGSDEFFLLLAEQLGFAPGEILYCDDGLDHLERAARLGFRTCRGVMGETWDRSPDEQGAAEFVIHSVPELLPLVDQLRS